MSTPDVRFEGAPQLGYMSLEQLREFAIREEISPTTAASQITATALYRATLRMGEYRSAGTDGMVIQCEEGFDAELSIAATFEAVHHQFINLDTLAHLVKTKGIGRRKSTYFDSSYSTQIGPKRTELARRFLEDRARFLGRQLG